LQVLVAILEFVYNHVVLVLWRVVCVHAGSGE